MTYETHVAPTAPAGRSCGDGCTSPGDPALHAKGRFGPLVADVQRASAALRAFALSHRAQATTPPSGVLAHDAYVVGELFTLVSEWIDSISSALGVDEEQVLSGSPVRYAAPEELPTEVSGLEVPTSAGGAPNGRSGLAPWQIRRVTMYIESHIDTVIRIGDLAAMCRLSTSHFIRAFRCSYGYSPHRFIMRRRTERAQGLMLTTTAPLGQIAQECGLADQSHLTRLFQRFVGESPGTWRRARTSPASSASA